MKSLFGTARRLLRTNVPAAPKKRALGFEALEARQLLSLNPSGFEQEMLEYLNEMRTDPDAGLARIVSSTNPLVATDASVQGGLDWFGVDGDLLASQWDALSATHPLAWNESLYDAATGHGMAMRDADQQAHQLPGGAGLSARVVAEGYTGWSQLAENIYGYSESPIFAHAGFAVDWGPGPGGMQSPAGHRLNMMSSGVREIGISAVAGLPGADLNPWIVTQDFGNRFSLSGSVYVLGVLYDDANANDFYSAGEGIGGSTVTVAGPGGSFTTSTMTAGGYQVLMPAHASPTTYTVTFSGGGLTAPVVQTVDVGAANVKVDGIVGATLALALDAASVSEGSTLSGTMTRSGNLTVPLIVSLSSSDAGEASVPVRVEIPAGLASAPFQLTGVNDSLIDGDQLVTVIAAASGFSGDQVNVQVLDVLPSGFTFSGSQLSIDGTTGNDAFGFAAGSDFHAVTRNGAAHQVSSSAVDRIVIRTLSGDDTVAVTGGTGQDTARIRPTWSRMDGDNYQLYVYDAEQVDFAADDADFAYLFDSAGNDRFNAWPTTAQMVGDGFVHSVSGAGRVYAYATAGGTDRAFLYDSTGADTLVARPDYSYLRGDNFYNYARGFDRVYAYATAGGDNDRAYLHDSLGADTLVARPDY
ncbi:MAG: CAP domain-containing protein, partial [Planctomycetota bacterium]|nr:CAP domain-containing protein [Planctomycetota bacterium]